MQDGNRHHPADFVGNRVTGIFFQNRAFYSTWFGKKQEYIHGIQMLPLTPALLLTRTPRFCQQEWDGILSKLPLDLRDPWTSILLSGNLAIIEPDRAYSLLSQMDPGRMDDGLTRVWALYWAAVMPTPGAGGGSSTHYSSSVQTSLQETATLSTRISMTSTWTLTTQSSTLTTFGSVVAGTTPYVPNKVSTTEIPCHTPVMPADIARCGHVPTDCDFSAPGQSGLFTAGCLHGGLGCGAGGRRCCRYCGFAQYNPIACPAAGGLPCSTTALTTTTTTMATTTRTASTTTTTTSADRTNSPGAGPSVTVSRGPGRAPTDDEDACGHRAAECVHLWGASVKFSSECMQGGLGCSALGKQCCRYCGFGSYLQISCDTPTSVTTSTTTLAAQCSHTEEQCVHPWGETMYATSDCLVGGLGCNALGNRCCRYCGFGAYVGVVCPVQTLQARSDSSSVMLLAMPRSFAFHSRHAEVSTTIGNYGSSRQPVSVCSWFFDIEPVAVAGRACATLFTPT